MTATGLSTDTQETTVIQYLGDAPIALFGFATAAAVVAIDWALKRVGLNVPSLMIWFVVPVGALGTGFVAASGFYFGARWTHQMPSRRMLINMVGVAACTWYAMQWTEWQTAKFADDGTHVADSVGFADYWLWQASHASYRVGHGAGTTGELGTAGYWVEGGQAIAFVLGGLALYLILASARACAPCQRYFKTVPLRKGNPLLDVDTLVTVLNNAGLALPNIGPGTAAVVGSKGLHGFRLLRDTCPRCADAKLVLVAYYGRDGSAPVGIIGCTEPQLAALASAPATPRVPVTT
jgi:hypothetical protein